MNRGLHLSLLIGSMKVDPAPRAVVEALSEVQVNASSAGQSGFQLKFTLGKRSPITQQLLPSGYFDPRRRVVIVATVKGQSHVLMDGIITQQDLSATNQAGESMLSITGLDLSALMDFIDLTGIPYPALPPHAVVAIILAKYAAFGVIPLPVPSLIGLIDNPLERWKSQQGTDLAYVQLLGSLVGHVFYVDPGPLPGQSFAYWGPEIRHGVIQPALTVNMDGASNVESLNFSYDGLSRTQLVAIVHNSLTKLPIPIPIPDVNPLKPPLAREIAKTLHTRNLSVAELDPPEAAQFAISVLSSTADAVTASGQLDVIRYGRILKPRQLVAIRGGGDYFDGRYFVKSVTHNIKRGSYTQSFSLARGGVKSDVSRVAS